MARRKHPGSIDRVGKRWRIRLGVAGQVHTWSFDAATKDQPGMTKAEVEQFAREKDAELRGRAQLHMPGPMPFSAVLTRFEDEILPDLAANTRKTYGYSLTAFRTYFVDKGSDPMVHAIHSGHIDSFLAWRRTHGPDGTKRDNPLSPRSRAKDRACLHAVFAFAKRKKLTQGNPVEDVKPPKGDQREPIILDADEYERLLAATVHNPMLHTFVLVLGETGMRCESEALWLRWKDVDFPKKRITVESIRKGRRTKSGKSRKVPMSGRLRDALKGHFEQFRFAKYGDVQPEWVFHHQHTRRHATAGDRVGTFRRAFANAVERAKVPTDLVQHDLRHRRVTTWLDEGYPVQKVQKAMGHADIRTTMMYEHLLDSTTDELVAKDYAEEAVA
jgi:integrase/recombinase XerD